MAAEWGASRRGLLRLTDTPPLYINRQLGRGYSNFGNNHFCDMIQTLHHYIYIVSLAEDIPTLEKMTGGTPTKV